MDNLIELIFKHQGNENIVFKKTIDTLSNELCILYKKNDLRTEDIKSNINNRIKLASDEELKNHYYDIAMSNYLEKELGLISVNSCTCYISVYFSSDWSEVLSIMFSKRNSLEFVVENDILIIREGKMINPKWIYKNGKLIANRINYATELVKLFNDQVV